MQFGKLSKEKLKTCRVELRELAEIVISLGVIDCSVTEGHRTQEKQDDYFDNGKSKVSWPDSKHNTSPSDAFDLVPYIDGCLSWRHDHCCVLAGIVLAVAAMTGIEIRWGGNWDMDGEPITDQEFQDLVHFEYLGKEE